MKKYISKCKNSVSYVLSACALMACVVGIYTFIGHKPDTHSEPVSPENMSHEAESVIETDNIFETVPLEADETEQL